MKTNTRCNNHGRTRSALLFSAGLAILAACQASAVSLSQVYGNMNSTCDEFGYVLPGTDPEADRFQNTVVEGDLVQVLLAVNGVIHPPNRNGTPHPDNIVLDETRVGLGVSAQYQRSGRFSGALAPRPGGGSMIFVRVFNERTTAEASYYGDSELFKVSSWKNTIFLSEVPETDTPLDPRDSDNDGVINSMEKSYSNDRDDDGLTTGQELVAGTDPKNPDDVMWITGMHPGEHGVTLEWEAKYGDSYVVEFQSSDPGATRDFQYLATVQAWSDKGQLLVPKWLRWQFACFRVRRVDS